MLGLRAAHEAEGDTEMAAVRGRCAVSVEAPAADSPGRKPLDAPTGSQT